MAKGNCQVEIRGKAKSALIYKPPFLKGVGQVWVYSCYDVC